jgi:two-component system, OmpR family, response regulator
VTSEGIKVLVVDDEPSIRELVSTVLRYEGFDIATAASGNEALREVERFRPDLVVLDVMLPDLSGFDVQRRLVESGRRLPVIFLTARDAVEDRVRGLTIGGDDYLTKPFSLEELVARVRAVLRRSHETKSGHLILDDLVLDEETYEVHRGDDLIDLTPTEFKLLRYLMRNPRRVLSKAQILDHVWEYDFGGDGNIVETYVSYLRRKIDAGRAPLIHTVRGVGYTMKPTAHG